MVWAAGKDFLFFFLGGGVHLFSWLVAKDVKQGKGK